MRRSIMSTHPSAVPMAGNRKPRGYSSANHETLGTDILALVDAVVLPETILGKTAYARLMSVDAKGWYPVGDLLDAFEQVGMVLGNNSLRKVGASIFKLSHEGALRAAALTPRELLFGFDAMYRFANRGVAIGGWKVLEFGPTRAVLEKATPHHCVVEEGLLVAAMAVCGVEIYVHQQACFRQGADVCQFVLSPVGEGGKPGHWPSQPP